jgi:hypothetical protein
LQIRDIKARGTERLLNYRFKLVPPSYMSTQPKRDTKIQFYLSPSTQTTMSVGGRQDAQVVREHSSAAGMNIKV